MIQEVQIYINPDPFCFRFSSNENFCGNSWHACNLCPLVFATHTWHIYAHTSPQHIFNCLLSMNKNYSITCWLLFTCLFSSYSHNLLKCYRIYMECNKLQLDLYKREGIKTRGADRSRTPSPTTRVGPCHISMFMPWPGGAVWAITLQSYYLSPCHAMPCHCVGVVAWGQDTSDMGMMATSGQKK